MYFEVDNMKGFNLGLIMPHFNQKRIIRVQVWFVKYLGLLINLGFTFVIYGSQIYKEFWGNVYKYTFAYK